jgi:enamine deaminase RidA (YjgF/YER057c/UK114 family)
MKRNPSGAVNTSLIRSATRTQQGQAIVFTVLFAGVTGLACLLLFNSGMLANTKTQLQNAADAGAYSAAIMLARDHNFSAYTNRAMVANQVAVAQLVSLKSYLEDAGDTHQRMNGPWLEFLAKIPSEKSRWEFAKNLRIDPVVNAYSSQAGNWVSSLDRLIRVFEKAQSVHHGATVANVMFVVDEVVKRNDPKAQVTTGTFSIGSTQVQLKRWRDYTKSHSANDASPEADRFADVVLNDDSTDRFIRNRISWPAANWAAKPVPLACLVAVPIFTAFAFTHGGGTILSQDKRRWLALDATMGAGILMCEVTTPLGPLVVPVPLAEPPGGSGGAVAGRNGAYAERNGYRGNSFSSRSYGLALVNPLTALPAWRRFSQGPGPSLDSTNGGLQNTYRDLADVTSAASRPANQTAELNGGQVPLTIEVEHVQKDIRTSAKIMGGARTIKLDDNLKGETMRTLAAAQAYFYRAKNDSSAFSRAGWRRDDGRTELANLFNPYWQARLSDHTSKDALLSEGAQ